MDMASRYLCHIAKRSACIGILPILVCLASLCCAGDLKPLDNSVGLEVSVLRKDGTTVSGRLLKVKADNDGLASLTVFQSRSRRELYIEGLQVTEVKCAGKRIFPATDEEARIRSRSQQLEREMLNREAIEKQRARRAAEERSRAVATAEMGGRTEQALARLFQQRRKRAAAVNSSDWRNDIGELADHLRAMRVPNGATPDPRRHGVGLLTTAGRADGGLIVQVTEGTNPVLKTLGNATVTETPLRDIQLIGYGPVLFELAGASVHTYMLPDLTGDWVNDETSTDAARIRIMVQHGPILGGASTYASRSAAFIGFFDRNSVALGFHTPEGVQGYSGLYARGAIRSVRDTGRGTLNVHPREPLLVECFLVALTSSYFDALKGQAQDYLIEFVVRGLVREEYPHHTRENIEEMVRTVLKIKDLRSEQDAAAQLILDTAVQEYVRRHPEQKDAVQFAAFALDVGVKTSKSYRASRRGDR